MSNFLLSLLELNRLETGNSVVVYELDLSKYQSVRKCAKELMDNESHIDILINNAGKWVGMNDLVKKCHLSWPF